jgi:hypothetical protein
MKTLRLLTLMAMCCAMGTMTGVAGAAESPPAKAATPAPAKPATQPAGESAAPKADEQSSGTQPATTAQGTQGKESAAEAEERPVAAAKPKGSGKSGSPERFVPSEQVRADFDVSFPIDI